MMKKLMISLLLGCSLLAVAQEKMPVIYPENRTLPKELLQMKARRMPADINMPDVQLDPAQENPIPHIRPQVVKAGAHRLAAASNTAGYLNPTGTLFCGMDENGKGNFFTTGAVVGAWSCDLPCWTWLNTATNWKSVKYTTWLSGAYPTYVDGALYSVDADGNFNDSIVSAGGWVDAYAKDADGDEGYYWQQAVPLQTVTFTDGTTAKYAMLNKNLIPAAGDKSTQSSLAYAAGGLPSGKSTDGLWPLTNAVNLTKGHTWFELVSETDDDGYVHYFFGSDSAVVSVDSVDHKAVYTRTAPVKLTTYYDAPQRMLYVKNITVALGANGYNAFHKDTLKLTGTLHLDVKDAKGNIIASSDATKDNCSNITYKAGQLLTFSFQNTSDYGEVLQEGFTVDDAFSVEITGFQPSDRFGIFSAPSSVYASKSEMLYADGKTRTVDYDPYIMLNGIYPTFETYTGTYIHQNDGISYPTYQDAMKYAYGTNGGDTIFIDFKAADGAGKYNYMAECSEGEAKGQTEFDIYSTFKPYDDNKYWLMDIIRPDYVLMSADYETQLNDDDDDPITLWNYYRLFTLYIYATDRPSAGDVIKIGKAGRYMTFVVTGVEDEDTSAAPAKKLLKNNQVLIEKGGHTYNMWGQEVK